MPARTSVATVVRLLLPFAPHVACELWAGLFPGRDLEAMPWPGFDPAALVKDTVEVAVQIGGKVRARILLAAEATEQEAIEAALADPKVAAELAGRTPRRSVYVRGRLVNLVP